MLRTAKRLHLKPHGTCCGDDYLSEVDCFYLNEWTKENYEGLNAVRSIEVQQKALEVKIQRCYNAIKELIQISHTELAYKIFEEVQLLSLPSKSWVNV